MATAATPATNHVPPGLERGDKCGDCRHFIVRPNAWVLSVAGFIIMVPVYLTQIIQYVQFLAGLF